LGADGGRVRARHAGRTGGSWLWLRRQDALLQDGSGGSGFATAPGDGSRRFAKSDFVPGSGDGALDFARHRDARFFFKYFPFVDHRCRADFRAQLHLVDLILPG
jgi:hypothetical protein